MKFDFAIGNPPYQEEQVSENNENTLKNYAFPVYHTFMDASYTVADKVELIHPARFLFNAGSTPKAWNQKILQDEHFKILKYEADCNKVFSGVDIKGGIVVSYRDSNRVFGAIDIFTPYDELNNILHKVLSFDGFKTIHSIIISSFAYHFTEKLYIDFPDARGCLSVGHDYDLKSNVFDKMPQPFHSICPNDGKKYLKILGRKDFQRTYRYILADYIKSVDNLWSYKVFLPIATGVGNFGETIAEPIFAEPGTGATETFMSIGKFDNIDCVKHLGRYIKTKFVRALWGILKRTQANTTDKWKYVPLQDFTDKSDIDWSKSVKEIDQQLYKKYGLNEDEIGFIESKVKEMA